MKTQEFNELLDYCLASIKEVLAKKSFEYAKNDDRLYNFYDAAKITGLTPQHQCWSFLSKHLVSIKLILDNPKIWTNEMIEEKIGDAINYLILLLAILTEERK
jgi:hypothetical protein